MAISVDDKERYIFNPNNPKQCKTYNLLLKIAKENPLVYVSDDYLTAIYEDKLIDKSFIDKLWDIPENFDNLSAWEKTKIFKRDLSEKEWVDEVFSKELYIKDNFLEKRFKRFFDYHPSEYLRMFDGFYDQYSIKDKISTPNNYSFANYKEFKDRYDVLDSYRGKKIIFTNNLNVICKSDKFYDISSIVVTSIKNIRYFYTRHYNNKIINSNVKPIFLNNSNDFNLLLSVLDNDLNEEKQKDIEKEEIPFLHNINIKNFFSIKNLNVENLKDKKEIYILGENGDGKTLFLQALAVALKGSERDGQEIFRNIKNEYSLSLEDTNKNIYNGLDVEYKNLFAYGANRNNNCQMLEDESGFLSLFDNKLDLKNPLKWLQKIDYKENRGDENLLSVDDAKNLLKSLLNSDVEIEISPDDVIFKEKGSEVSFEQLSAGYKGVITIIADLLVRLSENQPYVTDIKDFKGIVLIDEVELHLHPKWKYDFVKKIRNVFPNIQFIMTTHSPTVLLGASEEAVFYKIYKEDGEVHISNQIPNEGYTNNTLISSPLFDMETVKSRHYDLNEKSLSNDDMTFEKIHEVISDKIKNESEVEKDEISKLIDEEISKL